MPKVTTTARIDGLDELRKALRNTPKVTRKRMQALLADAADDVARDAIRHAPRDRGDLQRAIDSSGRGLTWRAGIVKGPVPSRGGGTAHMDPAIYGPMVEKGTTTRGAHPFMRPAAEGEANRLPGRVRVLARVIETEAESG